MGLALAVAATFSFSKCFIYARKHVHTRLHRLIKGTLFLGGMRQKLIIAIAGHTEAPTWKHKQENEEILFIVKLKVLSNVWSRYA